LRTPVFDLDQVLAIEEAPCGGASAAIDRRNPAIYQQEGLIGTGALPGTT
jgi:hypothetical protein